jgi:hypothetical protein
MTSLELIPSIVRKRRGACATFSRTVEISHNSTFWLELGAIAVVLRFVDEARSPFGHARFHIIEASPIMEKFPMSSKLNNYPPRWSTCSI